MTKLNEGAQAERRCVRAYLKRRIKRIPCGTIATEELDLMLAWLNKRDERVNAKVGGLGKK